MLAGDYVVVNACALLGRLPVPEIDLGQVLQDMRPLSLALSGTPGKP